MHQRPRPPPPAASPSSPSMNPSRTNNPREGGHSRLGSETPSYSETDEGSNRGDSPVVVGPSRETARKLDQIIQNLFAKSAILVMQSRMTMPTIMTKDNTIKTNKWFQIETDDTDAFREELRPFRTCGAFENRPPAMYVEVFLDTSELSSNQSLVIVDDNGRHHDATEVLREQHSSKSGSTRAGTSAISEQVVLERWRFGLSGGVLDESNDYGPTLPTVYKRCIVFMRSLFTTTRILPAAKLIKSIGKVPATRNTLKVRCRIMNASEHPSPSDDILTAPLFSGSGDVASSFNLGDTETPAGSFTAEVLYRNECNFQVENSETLLSEKFMGAEDVFRPTLAPRHRRGESRTDIGSLPAQRQYSPEVRGTQTYGSMSTFHGEAPPLGASPISALRNARNYGSQTSSPTADSVPQTRPSTAQRPSSIALDSITMARRPSLSFNPFKAGSVSGSPISGTSLPQGSLPPGSPASLTRGSMLNQPRNRSSLTAGMPASLRGPPVVPQDITGSASSSPRPAPISKYSSSFSHRRGRLSYGGTSRADDDDGSSGKQSLSSSVQPGSGMLPATGSSSGSLQTDDDNLSDFLKVLETNKSLPGQRANRGEANRKATNQLNRFQSMRESHNLLSESLTSSMMLQRSSSTSSHQLNSVPPMVGGTSLSISSSPGKPMSPHTPHTPAIPSKLSANSIVDYSEPRRFRARAATAEEPAADPSNATGAAAIDIPTSPRPYQYRDRRSSSVAQGQRVATLAEEEGSDIGPFHRALSLGAGDREPPSLSDLRGFGRQSGSLRNERVLQPATELEPAAASAQRVSPAVQRARDTGARAGMGPRTISSSSLATGGSGSESRDHARGNSWTRPLPPTMGGDEADDEYPLLFDMSELGRNSEQGPGRRSLEEGRGGGDSGSSARRGGKWLGQ